jgi:ribonucleoside-diphosphate reductase alpha chain
MDGNYQKAEHTYIYQTVQNLKRINKSLHYQLPDEAIRKILECEDPFEKDAYRVSVFLSAYSRVTNSLYLEERSPRESSFNENVNHLVGKKERKETWCDVCVRVIEGLFSFYASYLTKNILPFPEDVDDMATEALLSMVEMQWLPPGRGLFAMGTDHTFKNGNAALNNCYAVSTKEDLVKASAWTMDMLMCGGGVGFDVTWNEEIFSPDKSDFFTCVIPDTRQGWVCALELLMRAYIPIKGKITNKFPKFDFSEIRKYGAIIKGFGGTSSGPEPLRVLLVRVETFLDAYINQQNKKDVKLIYLEYFANLVDKNAYSVDYFDEIVVVDEILKSCEETDKPYDHVRLVADIFNAIGQCVVSGNVRRSAQIAIADPEHKSFLDLKSWTLSPERRPWMHLSNNSIRLWEHKDFEEQIPHIAERMKNNGEPGIINMINVKRYGRYGDGDYGEDKATLVNPCAETQLESYEPCCLSTINPYKSIDMEILEINEVKMENACKWATFYATVVTTIPHHWPETNQIVSRNRRIGVSYNGIADVRQKLGNVKLIKSYRENYFSIRKYNTQFTEEFGIPNSIRVTVIKPEGTLSIIAGTSAGVHYPIIRCGWRRVAFDNESAVLKVLQRAKYMTEVSTVAKNQTYVLFPISSNAEETTKDVDIYQKMTLATGAQKHYADNSVSFTCDFSPSKEGDLVEEVLSEFIPRTKVISIFPSFEGTTVQFKHLPFEETSREEYEKAKKSLKTVKWKSVFDQESIEDADRSATAYCTGDTCQLK